MPVLVSIIVPSFNQGKFIKATLDSIISQDYRPLEVIVVDGASKDETVDVLHQYDHIPEVKWVSEPDKGVVDGVNKGFRRAQGEIAAIQSSDDYYLPGAIRRTVEVFQQNPGTNLVYADYIKVDQAGKQLFQVRVPSYSLEALYSGSTFVAQPTAFFRLEIAKRLGGWDADIPYVPDTDLWLRLALAGGVIKVDDFWAANRVHQAQRDHQKAAICQDYRKMVDKILKASNVPPILKRAAKYSLLQIELKYGNKRTNWEINKVYWKSIFTYPSCLMQSGFEKHRLVPGYFCMTGILKTIRNRLGSFLK